MNQRYNLVPKSGELQLRHSAANFRCLVFAALSYAILLFATPSLGPASTLAIFAGINSEGLIGKNIQLFQLFAFAVGASATAIQLIEDARSSTFRADFASNFLRHGIQGWLISYFACAGLAVLCIIFMGWLWTFDPASPRDALLSTRIGVFAAFLGMAHFVRLTSLHTVWSVIFIFKR